MSAAPARPRRGSAVHQGLVGARNLVGTPYLSSPALREEYVRQIAPRTEAAKAYLDTFLLDALPADATNLLHLLYSLVSVSFAVEIWKQPNVPDSGAAYLDLVGEPTP